MTKLQHVNGFLFVNKPKNITSHQVCYLIKKHFALTKVGHCGTLDLNASGLLIVALNQATKYSSYLLNLDKEYLGEAILGEKRDTYDIKGKVVARVDNLDKLNISKTLLCNLFKKHLGESLQSPPIFSSIKKQGKRLYKYALNNQEVKIDPRKIIIHDLVLLEFNNNYFRFRVKCSKGTYVRSLVNDIGEELGSYAYLKNLKRTKIGKIELKMAISLEDLFANSFSLTKCSCFNYINEALSFIPTINLCNKKNANSFINGLQIRVNQLLEVNKWYLISFNQQFLGIAKAISTKELKGLRIMHKINLIT